MIELVVFALLGVVVTIAVLLGRSQANAAAADQVRDAQAYADAERAAAEAEREARERAEQNAEIQQEARDAAPTTLEPAARLDAVERWARMRAAEERERRAKAAGTVRGADDTPPAMPGRGTTAPGGKPDR